MSGAGNRSSLPLPWSCTDQALLEMLKQRDPSGKGLPSVQALRLLTSLLHWNPAARPTPQQACVVSHSHVPYTCENLSGYCFILDLCKTFCLLPLL